MAGWLLPFAATGLFLVTSKPGHSEDYGWGLLAFQVTFVSLGAAAILMWLGVLSLLTTSPKTKVVWSFLAAGALGLSLLLYLLLRLAV